MVTVTYPGVYIEEVTSGARPIEAVGTSTAAFVGLTQKGPAEAMRVTSWSEFQRLYGGFIVDGWLPHSVFQFFNNGGRQCYIVRVIPDDVAVANVTVKNRAATAGPGIKFAAKSPGTWGNYLYLTLENSTRDPGNEFKVSVRWQQDRAVIPDNFLGIPAAEVFDDLSVDPVSERYYQTVLANGSTLINAAPAGADTAVQRGLHRGGEAPKLPLGANRSFGVNVNGDGLQTVTLPATVANETDLGKVATEIQNAVRALTKKKASTDTAAFNQFTCESEQAADGRSRLVLRSGTESADSSVRIEPAAQDDATTRLLLGPANGGVSEDGIAVRRPAVFDALQIGDAAVGGNVVAVAKGDDGSPITGAEFHIAFSRLDTVTDASLLAVPGEGTPEVVNLGMSYCATRPLQDMFFVGEMADHDITANDAAAFRTKLTALNSYGAVYFPWVKALDPSGRSSEPILLPPSGFIAGLYARIDAARGVWKAPAGTEAGLNEVVGLAAELTDVEHGNLNPLGVNVLRRLSAGVVAFGARTLSSDPEWRYIPVRRTAILLRVSIYNGIQWAVFEPNDESLWSQLRLNIGSFMTTLFRQGAFQGSTTAEAFFVKCDGETTTQADIDRGVVNVQVGFAALKPAEFVVVTISQKAGQAST
jgi:phage tail sheath protein FI